MKPFRLTFEYGFFQDPEPSIKKEQILDTSKSWDLIVDGRKRLVKALEGNDSSLVEKISQWVGGALAIYAQITDKNAVDLDNELRRMHPAPEVQNPYREIGEFFPVERKRPKPPPGAPRPVSVDELSEQERLELGILET